MDHSAQGYAHLVGTLAGNADDCHIGIEILQPFTPGISTKVGISTGTDFGFRFMLPSFSLA